MKLIMFSLISSFLSFLSPAMAAKAAPVDNKTKTSQNPNVEKITENHVDFKASFKIKAEELYIDGKSPGSIFTEAQIPLQYFKDRYFDSCLKRWKKK